MPSDPAAGDEVDDPHPARRDALVHERELVADLHHRSAKADRRDLPTPGTEPLAQLMVCAGDCYTPSPLPFGTPCLPSEQPMPATNHDRLVKARRHRTYGDMQGCTRL